MNLKVEEIGDAILEAGQNILLMQDEYTNIIRLNLKDFDEILIEFVKEIMDYLLSHELRLFEDVCDEDGTIIDSYEQTVKTLEAVEFTEEHIILTYKQAMLDLMM